MRPGELSRSLARYFALLDGAPRTELPGEGFEEAADQPPPDPELEREADAVFAQTPSQATLRGRMAYAIEVAGRRHLLK